MQGNLFKNILSGIVAGVIIITYCFSFAALLFSGDLAFGLSYGLGACLVSAAVISFWVAIFSSFNFSIGGPQGNAIAVLAVIAGMTVSAFPPDADPQTVIHHIFFIFTFGTFLTGLFLYVLGAFRAGKAIRFIPYPVVCSFLAAAGWLVFAGGIAVMTDQRLSWDGLATFREHDVGMRLTAGLFFATFLSLVLQYSKHYLTLPLALLTGVSLVYGGIHHYGLSLDEARTLGWLFQGQEQLNFWSPWNQDVLASIDWRIVQSEAGSIITLVLVTAMTVLVTASGLEVQAHEDADLDTELECNGLANVLSSAAGGFVGYILLNPSSLNRSAGSTSRLSGIVVSVLCLFVIFKGSDMIAYVPKVVLGGLLVQMGAKMLYQWLLSTRHKLSLTEYVLVLIIFGIIILWNFIAGLVVGLIAGCLIFALNYSRVRVVKHLLKGSYFRSNRVRPADENKVLNEHGDRISILTLQGYLFFGTSHGLYQFVRRIDGDIHTLVFDCHLVTGMDSSASSSFEKIHQFAEDNGIFLVFGGMNELVEKELRLAGFLDHNDDIIHAFKTPDIALEWAESRLVEKYIQRTTTESPILKWFADEFKDPELAKLFISYLDRRAYDKGSYLCKQGEPSDSVFFVEAGQVTILFEQEGGESIRLRSMEGSNVVGEMGFCINQPRSASVFAEKESVIHVLDKASFARMQKEHPELVTKFLTNIVRTLSQRMDFSNRLLAELQD